MTVTVLLPCQNARHLLWRSLASIAAQTLQPAQVLVLDRGSTDGLADWLRVRWPGIDRRALPSDADSAAIGAAIAAAIVTPAVAILRPGEHWPCTHLEALLDRVGGAAPSTLVATASLTTAAGAADLPWPPADTPPSAKTLDDAIASLPPGPEIALLDLRAAGSPLGLLDLLGLAVMLGPDRAVRAMSLADPVWPALEAMPAGTPLLVSLFDALGPDCAAEQLCIEELLRRATKRPVRLVLGGISATSPPLLSRLLDAVLAHPDAELWVSDMVSRRIAAALIGAHRVRLVAPPLLALAPLLRELCEREPIRPAMLGMPDRGQGLAHRMHDHATWWAGFDPNATRRLGLALARVIGAWHWLKGPLLQQAWLTALVGWAAACSHEDKVCTSDVDLAILAGLCGRPIELTLAVPKQRDLVATWRREMAAAGIVTA